MLMLARPTTSTKTCPPMLTTKSTCWTTTASPATPVFLPTTWLHWAWFTSSKSQAAQEKGASGAFFYVWFNLAGILLSPW
ncbi:hypothetical protein KVMX100_80298 [Klebsiella variicola]|nr:hypothetical protein KVMX100_80298 [Klebsiella variicola]